jgi:hypothetical protein
MATTYNFTTQRKVTYKGAQFTITVNGVALNLTGAHLLCEFKTLANPSSPAILTWTDSAGMTITSPTNGIFTFNPQIIDIPGGSYLYDVKITLASGEVDVYVTGTLIVTEIVSYA